MEINFYNQLNRQLKSVELETYCFPNSTEIESLLVEIPNIPNEMGILSVSLNEPFKDYILSTCNLHFLEIPQFVNNNSWLYLVNQINISLPFSGLYIHDDGISFQYKFPAGSIIFDNISYHLVCTLQMIVQELERVYDLIYTKIKDLDMNDFESNKAEIDNKLIEFEQNWYSQS